VGEKRVVITTKVGDKGKTAILFGHMIEKSHPLLDIGGSVDELNSALGIARAHVIAPGLKQDLLYVQRKLFVLGAEIATRKEDTNKLKATINTEDINNVEKEIAVLEKYNDLNNWFIPGESPSSAYLEHARTIARRLERRLWQHNHYNDHAKVYVNRLSDYLWLLAQREEYYLRGIEKTSTQSSDKSTQSTIF
jgi:cob(I)alamin adenosyltransferase